MNIMWYFRDTSFIGETASQTVWYHIRCFFLTSFSLEISFCASPRHLTWARCFGKDTGLKETLPGLYRPFLLSSLGTKNESSHPVQSQKWDILGKNICCVTFILQKNIESNRFTSPACCNAASYSKIIYHKRIKDVRIWVTIYCWEQRP